MSTPAARLQAQPKLPPYSIEAEQSVLGGLMLDNRAWNELGDRLSAEDFYREDHQLIYRAICELVGTARPCDFVTLSEHLKARGQLDEAGGLAYLGSLANDTPSAANVLAYADIVRERAVLRGLVAAGGDIAELGFRADGRSYAELLDIAEQKVFALRSRAEHARSSYHAMPELMKQLEEKIEFLRSNPSGLAGLSTGFVDLDAKTTGLHPGDLVILAGRPSMGKTSFALNVAEHVALYEKKPAAVFSMEMPAEQLALRMLSSFARIPMGRLRSGDLDDRDWDRLVSQGGLIREAPLYIDETGALSPLDLRARARRIKARHGLGLIVVDYIQLMQVPGTKENRTNEISEISRSLKALAKELEVPVIALSQLNRGVEQRDNKRPRMADLRESGGIEQDADLVVFIYRDEVYNRESPDAGTAEIIIAKQRNGPLGTVKTAFLGEFTRFDNLAQGFDDGYA
ncbi:primary replicative DNA helicase [Sinimarinibacterium flocculans]|uniref:Replicative DNA helicase n=1 Tax=Sinimarinibacterium flocculans TaxID=985250 RepID=A0A318EGQ2_9GAMM|nr:replicative DNA helicase [Sinimarinibacterium flocculans]PXV71120.1 primary replicative DNA helicase [Sinimarinibacterium flocculans]